MNYFQSLLSGVSHFGSPTTMVVMILGTLLGVFVGVVPGLGGIVLLVVLLPFLYNVNPVIGLALLLASHSAIYYAGSTTAILINTPGAPESAATCFDGYAMTQKGQVGRALGISAAATSYGGLFGAVAILVAIPVMVKLVNIFHPPEYFFLTILAVVLIGQLQSGSPTKGILSGLFGFLLSFGGAAASTGTLRYTFGLLGLYDGINIAAAAIGLFAISQMFVLFAANKNVAGRERIHLSRREVWGSVGGGVKELFQHKWLATKSAFIGVMCGVIPGIGSTAANFLSYGYAMRSSKHPERYGTGIPEGIIAPEGSSISKEAGSLIPTVALGVPNGPAMAILLAAFSILGLQPGPTMLHQHLPLVFWMVAVIAFSSILASVLGLGLAPLLAQITVIPGRVLVPFVLVLASIGAYASTTELLQVVVMMIMGAVGLAMRRHNYSLPAVIVGLVLGATAENNLILTIKIFQWRFFERPLSDLLILGIIAVIVLGIRKNRQMRKGTGVGADGISKDQVKVDTSPLPLGEVLFDVAWVVGAAIYIIIGMKYPSPASTGPVYLGSAALLVGILQLVGAFVPKWRRVTHGDQQAHQIVSLIGKEPEVQPSGMSAPPPLGSAGHSGVQTAGTLVDMVEEAEEVAPSQNAISAAGSAKQQGFAVLMAAVLIGLIYLVGYMIATPLWTLAYFLFVRKWKIHLSIIAAAAVLATFYLISHLLTGVIFPGGML
ncbi:MAG: tripartite tricarboxylate transporter permease [Actinomycetota bacterium]|nr:tripartite tricarboxylate transporter permease [Actinomycetota bacterium]